MYVPIQKLLDEKWQQSLKLNSDSLKIDLLFVSNEIVKISSGQTGVGKTHELLFPLF